MKKILLFLVLFHNLFPLGFNFEKGKMLFPGSLYGQYQGVEGECINGYMTCDCDGWILFLECSDPGTIDCQCIDPVIITPPPDFTCPICGQDPCVCGYFDPCSYGSPDYSDCVCLGINCDYGSCDPSSPYYDECSCLGLNCDDGGGNNVGEDPTDPPDCNCIEIARCSYCGKVLPGTGCSCGEECSGHSTDPCNQFEHRIEGILNFEGGFVNDPNDPGGATNRGICWDTWLAVAQPILGEAPTLSNLQALTENEATQIYEVLYWDKIFADDIIDGDLRFLLFDFYVNAGNNAIKVLQKTINQIGGNVTVDGAIGSQTISAINASNNMQLYNTYRQNRLLYYQDLSSRKPALQKFLNGWTNRVNAFAEKTINNNVNVNCNN